MKKRLICLGLVALFLFMMSVSVIATDLTDDIALPIEVGTIDPEINAIVEAYLNGTYTPQNQRAAQQAEQLFETVGASTLENGSVDYIYDLKQTGQNTFEATQIAVYATLEQQNQGELGGVILFCTMVYDQKNFGDFNPCIKLMSVKGGVVRNTTTSRCTNLSLYYGGQGAVRNADGSDAGAASCRIDPVSVVSYPTAGISYTISGPNDYYYDLNASLTTIGAYCDAVITFGGSALTDTLTFGSSMSGF